MTFFISVKRGTPRDTMPPGCDTFYPLTRVKLVKRDLLVSCPRKDLCNHFNSTVLPEKIRTTKSCSEDHPGYSSRNKKKTLD